MYRDPVSPTGPSPGPWICSNLFNLDLTAQRSLLQTSLVWNIDYQQVGGWHSDEMPSCLKQFYMDQWRVKNNFLGEGCHLFVWPFLLKNRMKMKKILAYRGGFLCCHLNHPTLNEARAQFCHQTIHSRSSSSLLLSPPSHNEFIALRTGKDWSSHYIDFFLWSCSPNWQKTLEKYLLFPLLL